MVENEIVILTSGRVSEHSLTVATPVCGKTEAQFADKALCLLVSLHPHPDLWSRVMGSDQKNQVKKAGDRKEFLPQGFSV